MTQRILFVCTGNICRSPAAEVLLRAEAAQVGVPIEVASAGTSDWHVGDGPTSTNILAAQKAGHDLSSHRAQQVTAEHFQNYNWLIGMTRAHCRHLVALQPPSQEAKIALFSDFDPDNLPKDFPDPYGHSDQTYDSMWMKLKAAMPAVLKAVTL